MKDDDEEEEEEGGGGEEEEVEEEEEEEEEEVEEEEEEEEPCWSKVARRRSEARVLATASGKCSESIIYDESLAVVETIRENAGRTKIASISPEADGTSSLQLLSLDKADHGAQVSLRTKQQQKNLATTTPNNSLEFARRAVVEAIRDVAPEDLDAEVASFDERAGTYRVESKVKIHTGQIISMAVERTFHDFSKLRTGILVKIEGDHQATDLALSKLQNVPRKRFKSALKAAAANVLNGKRKGELKWQGKQVAKLDSFVNSSVDLVSLLKETGHVHANHFSFVSGFGRFEVEDFLLCFLCQGAFFTGILTIDAGDILGAAQVEQGSRNNNDEA